METVGVMIRTVLVIEDHRPNLLMLQGHLEQAGYRVLTATGAAEGLALARAGGVDLVTLDVLMEPVDGWAVFEALRADPSTRDIPVVFVTIVDQPERGEELGAEGYIVKPFRGQSLLAVVERALRREESP